MLTVPWIWQYVLPSECVVVAFFSYESSNKEELGELWAQKNVAH